MSTITREFTKEQLQQIIETDHVQCGEASSLARIALASLEAVHVGEVSEQRDGLVMDGMVDLGGASTHRIIKGASKMKRLPLGTKFYTAPPAPVSVPDEVCWEDVPEEITEDDMALASAWAHGFNQCRAAMLKHSEPFIVTSDHRMMEMPQVEAINAVTAMLQGVEPVTTAYKLPFEQWLSKQTGTIDVECGCVMTEVFFHWLRVAYDAGNSPVIADGWVLVPEEPTHEMLEAGDEQFGTYDVYRRMIEAAPKLE